MSKTHRWNAMATIVALVAIALALPPSAAAQRGRGGFGAGAADENLPEEPTPVALATVSGPVSGPGAIYESVQSLPPGMGLDHYDYEAVEYFVTGTAAGEPYKTRVVIRRPRNNGDFSGLIMSEAMHPSGSAHIFEYTSHYLMDSGHIGIEVLVSGLNNLTGFNAARYGDFSVSGDQVSEVLAQVGAMIRSGDDSPLEDLPIRKMVLAGTSATAAILTRYLPSHMVYRTPDMGPIYDGFMPHSTGATIQQVDVPLIQVPTMTEVAGGTITSRQDGDARGDQYRIYEFAGMAHVDMRDSVRFMPDPCRFPMSPFPLQAYLSVALNHLFRWTDEGLTPPRAPRILRDRDTSNDGSLMALAADGNVQGGVRTPYVDVPVAKFGVRNEGANPLIPNPSPYIAAGGLAAANQMCGLGGYRIAFSDDQLKTMYGSADNYRTLVENRLNELETAGWSLPIYREMILSDAAKLDF